MNISPCPTPSHEEVHRIEDPSSGTLGFIAIHSTKRGPAAGGLRIRPYPNEAEALTDVLRLSEAMSYKNAAADLPLGGGKAVIVADPASAQTSARLRVMARAIQSLQGRYYTAEDMGMTPERMRIVAEHTQYVAGLPEGAYASGDPSPLTAQGVFNALRTTLRHATGLSDLRDRSVAIQGLGNVGYNLCRLLHDCGARLIVSDTDPKRVSQAVQHLGAEPCSPDKILYVQADAFAPCAIGGILSSDAITGLNLRIIAGGANNQLASDHEGDQLHQRGILYAPDFIVNAGGIINVAAEILKITDRKHWVAARLQAADQTLDTILTEAKRSNQSPNHIAKQTIGTLL